MAAQGRPPEEDASDSLERFAKYPFHSDASFQQGLVSLFPGTALDGKSEDEKEEMIRRARVFYFNRLTGCSLTLERVLEYERSSRIIPVATDEVLESNPQRECEETETRSLSFAELKILIEEGKTDHIPHNKVISNALNDSSPSQSVTPARRKPWESS